MSERRAIERGLPIVQLNPIARRDQRAHRPVYTMHKWFARRSETTFRSILLGAALSETHEDGRPVDIMEELYEGHVDDPRLRRPDGAPLRVLDPFMGGGTTVVEALRLGLDVTGSDLNPIAWFIVKGETAQVDLDELDAAYQRLAEQVRDELLGLYRTRCPLSGEDDADVIYAFWVKQGVCVDPDCGAHTDLFKSYEVGRKRGDATIPYLPVHCPGCDLRFDWELARATVTAGGPQVAGQGAEGKGRPEGTACAFGRRLEGVDCPGCGRHAGTMEVGARKPDRKKVALRVLVDPSTGDLFEVRGALPETVRAPWSGYEFSPADAPIRRAGRFTCGGCGRTQAIVESADARGAPLPFRYYGFYARTPNARDPSHRDASESLGLPTNNGKWFAAVRQADLARVEGAREELERRWGELPLPVQEIYDGYNTNRLVIHQYRRWVDVYSPRHLVALGALLEAIATESDDSLRDALLGALQAHLDNASNLCSFQTSLTKLTRVTAGHDYRNPTSIVENKTWGTGAGQGPFRNCVRKHRTGLEWRTKPDVLGADLKPRAVGDLPPHRWQPDLRLGSALAIDAPAQHFDLIVTDPPYAGSVQYAEMSDWSYVWLHQVLKDVYPDEFGPEITLKAQEIIENGADKDAAFFFEQLTEAWRECHRVLVDDGLLVFTFHHKEGDRWTGLLRSIFDAGFYLVAAYPTHSEALNSIVIQATKGITYDIIHVCRKRTEEARPIPWTRLRREVRRAAAEQLRELEAGQDVLPAPDVWMILLGRALRLFSRHYGKVVDHDGSALQLEEALERIRVLVHEVRGEELPLPGVLRDVDGLSQVAFLHVVGAEGWARDDLHKELRGYALGPDALTGARLVREVEGAKGRLEPVPPLVRVAEHGDSLRSGPGGPLIDKLHLLLATMDAGRAVEPLLRRWSGLWSLLVEGLTWLGKKDPSLRQLCELSVRRIEAQGPDDRPVAEQLGLFEE